jgi:protein TonB
MRTSRPSPGFWISLALHVAVFLASLLLFKTEVQYAVDSGRNSVEVNLVAAAPEPEAALPPPPLPEPEMPPTPEPPKPDDVVVPAVEPAPPPPVTPPPPVPEPPKPAPPAPQPPTPVLKRTAKKGDGSAPKPGQDATTAHSDGGALPTVKPDYLRNPPPVYPEDARRHRQEGLVVIEVIVGTDGNPENVELSESSGVTSLDNSALQAVRGWRFRPATMAGIKIKSRVLVPVRFKLES